MLTAAFTGFFGKTQFAFGGGRNILQTINTNYLIKTGKKSKEKEVII